MNKRAITSIAVGIAMISQAWAFSGYVLITDARIVTLKSHVENKIQPTYQAWQAVKSYVDAHQYEPCRAPSFFDVSPRYTNPTAHATAIASIDHDGPLAYKLALAYRLTGNETYAANSARLISGWNKTTFSTASATALVVSNRFPALIEAANLIKHSPQFTATMQSNFKTFVRQKLLPRNTMSRPNNWGDWGLLLVVSSAAYLQDQTLFNSAVARWKYFIENQINSAGAMKYEVTRCGGSSTGGCSGIQYSNFALMPLTEAAEIMKVNGVDIFDYTSPSGHTLRKAYNKMAYWSRFPCTFPYYSCPTRGIANVWYMEILNPIYPNSDAAWLLNKYRPLDCKFSLPALTLIH